MTQSPVKIYADDRVYFKCLSCWEECRPKWPATVESFLAQVARFEEGHQHEKRAVNQGVKR